MRAAEPSERNFVVFAAIEFEGQSLRSVAAKHNVSAARVQQIVTQTRAWFVATTPEWVGGVPLAMQPLVAARMYDERLAHFARQAIEAWENSKGLVSVIRKANALASSSQGQTTTTQSAGQPRYLLAAARLSKMQFEGALRLAAWRNAHRDNEALLAETSSASPYAREEMQTTDDEGAETEAVDVNNDAAATSDVAEESYEPVFEPISSAPNPMRARKERRRRERALRRKLAKK